MNNTGNVVLSGENKVKSRADQMSYFAHSAAAANKEKGYKEEQFAKTQICRDMLASLNNYFEYTDKNTDIPAIDAYWETKGVTRFCFDMDDPERAWTAYMPSGLYFDAPENYKYPVVFVTHGGNNTILMTESYGWSELCGREGFITVIPWAQAYGGGNLIITEVPRILGILKEKFAIDESRIYCAGFSAGGRTCINALMEYPDVFAAGAFQPTSLFPFEENAQADGYGYKTVFSYDDYERVKSHRMPFILYAGSYESCFPISLDYPLARKVSSANLTRYLDITGALHPAITDEQRNITALRSGNTACRFTGFEFKPVNTRIVPKQGTNCILGDFTDENDVSVFRCLVVEGMPHWPLYCEAELCWEFLSRFARNRETGELITL